MLIYFLIILVSIKHSTNGNMLNEYYLSKIQGFHESTLFTFLFPNFGSIDYHEFILLFVKVQEMLNKVIAYFFYLCIVFIVHAHVCD